jgi:hypothetical protein
MIWSADRETMRQWQKTPSTLLSWVKLSDYDAHPAQMGNEPWNNLGPRIRADWEHCLVPWTWMIGNVKQSHMGTSGGYFDSLIPASCQRVQSRESGDVAVRLTVLRASQLAISDLGSGLGKSSASTFPLRRTSVPQLCCTSK